MFSKFLVLTLFALHCNCQDLIGVNGDTVSTVHHRIPFVKTYSGISDFRGYPISSYLSSPFPLSYDYGYGLSGLSGYGLNFGYLNNLQHSVYAPSVYSYAPRFSPSALLRQNTLAISQPSFQTLAVDQRTALIGEPKADIVVPRIDTITESHRPVSAAIRHIGRTVEYREVPYSDSAIVPQHVIVEPSNQPIHIHFRSRSSAVKVTQEHIPGDKETLVQQTKSVEPPSRAFHEVIKPVIQEVREIIQPYRQITQEIQPVVENVHRVVSQGVGNREPERPERVTQPPAPVEPPQEEVGEAISRIREPDGTVRIIEPKEKGALIFRDGQQYDRIVEPQVRVEGNALKYDVQQTNEDIVKYLSSQ